MVTYFIVHFNGYFWVYIVEMYMYLFPCLYCCNVYAFIPMVLFI